MTDKCFNKILFYYDNPHAMNSIPDEILMDVYQSAKQQYHNEDFILLFESELRKRGIID